MASLTPATVSTLDRGRSILSLRVNFFFLESRFQLTIGYDPPLNTACLHLHHTQTSPVAFGHLLPHHTPARNIPHGPHHANHPGPTPRPSHRGRRLPRSLDTAYEAAAWTYSEAKQLQRGNRMNISHSIADLTMQLDVIRNRPPRIIEAIALERSHFRPATIKRNEYEAERATRRRKLRRDLRGAIPRAQTSARTGLQQGTGPHASGTRRDRTR